MQDIRALSAATESRNSVTKIKPNTPHSAYRVARPSVRITCMYMVRLYKARTDRDELLRNRTNTCDGRGGSREGRGGRDSFSSALGLRLTIVIELEPVLTEFRLRDSHLTRKLDPLLYNT
ncbi:hypothetical protein EVAR_75751_1 [Eumeta japonica]|uniref:Uncharacterized protein n=1 Tax=Eumeta variegata TaxID=151549 RepID=A0A4C1TFS9_EUMVA|nr:hypothetical protein EVAR_75751_1 [Eumeta japonica]